MADASGEETAGGGLGHPTRAELFEVLSNGRRRDAIRYLLQRDEPVPLRELSAHVAARETGKPVAEVTSSERHRVYNALQQAHLPKMERADVVSVERGVVEPTDGLDEFKTYLEVDPRGDNRWSVYYLTLGVIGLSVALGSVIDVPPLTAIPPTIALGGLAFVLSVSAAVNVYTQTSLYTDTTAK